MRPGGDLVDRRTLARLSPEVRRQVEEAIERARTGKVRFPSNDGKEFANSSPAMRLPDGVDTKWTAAAAGAKRGIYRVLIEGPPASPRSICLWDHGLLPVRVGP